MKIVISPAKSLNWDVNYPEMEISTPLFLDDAVKVNAAIKKYSRKKLAELQSISKNLADLNWQRNQTWQSTVDTALCKPAVYAFNGEVYTGLDITTFETDKLENLNSNLRILSGLYGILRPMDYIMPYRLEMGASIKIRRRKNLYHFWSETVTNQLNQEMDEGEVLLNLASSEYFKVVDQKKLKNNVVHIKFKDWSNGNHKVLSFFAKKARGSMARFILENTISDLNGVMMFDVDGYYFDQKSSDNDNLVFLNDRK